MASAGQLQRLLLRCLPAPAGVPRQLGGRGPGGSAAPRQPPAGSRALAMAAGAAPGPSVSRRVSETDSPCIVQTKRLVASVDGTLSLAQGVVFWGPPPEAVARATAMAADPSVSAYGPDEGLPALRAALRAKVEHQNGLQGYDVMVTAGANQGFANLVLALLDPSDRVALFAPYYFNHLMALQMTGGGAAVALGPCHPATLHPDLEWLAAELAGPAPPKMVVLCNPCNPTGVLLSGEEVRRAADLCAAAGSWLVLDNTYEHFVWDGRAHHCEGGPGIINLFSFSKAYGMMGWRVGYIAFPEAGAGGALGSQLLKVQDTVPICPTQISQHVALAALGAGRSWVAEQVDGLSGNREALIDALSPLGALGAGVAGGEGAIYLWGRLPPGCEDDGAVVEWLVRKHRVCLIPGSACGAPGHVRAAFANLRPALCAEAAARLKAGLQELAAGGMAPVRAFLGQGPEAQAAVRGAAAAKT